MPGKNVVTVVASARAKRGKEDLLEKALREVVLPTHQEPGCILYAVHRGLEKTDEFLVFERWATMADLNAHLQTSHVQKLFDTIKDLVEGAPSIVTYDHLREGMPEKNG